MIAIRWYDDPRLEDVWKSPADLHLSAMAARGEALAAAIHRDEETHDLVVIDEQGVDDFLAYAGRDYDLEQGA